MVAEGPRPFPLFFPPCPFPFLCHEDAVGDEDEEAAVCRGCCSVSATTGRKPRAIFNSLKRLRASV